MFKTVRRQLLYVDRLRAAFAYFRYIYFVKILRRLRTLEATDANPITVKHNLAGLVATIDSKRSSILVRPLSVVETVHADSTVLSIGPRSESELFLLEAYGFHRKNIRGFDLISYSPLVDLGDMHAMPYSDNTWDVVISSMVLSYSDNQQKAVDEMIRVARPNGIIALSVEHVTQEEMKEIDARHGYIIDVYENRIQTVDAILAMFKPYVGVVHFSQDGVVAFPPNNIKGSPARTVSVVSSLNKTLVEGK
jgi:SAM-dependent methyltransferase